MSDQVAHLLNAALLLATGFLLATEGVPDDGYVVLVLVMLAAPIASSYRLWQRAREDAPTARAPLAGAVDEMDARRVLDIDARLEALERREVENAEGIRQLAARGEQSAPAQASDCGGPSQNTRIRA